MSLPNFDLSGINTGLPNLASYVRGIADSVTAWAAAKFDNSNLLAPYVTFPIPVNLAGQTLAGLSVQNVPIQLPNVIVIPNKLVVAYDSDAGATTLTADVTNMAGVSYVAGAAPVANASHMCAATTTFTTGAPPAGVSANGNLLIKLTVGANAVTSPSVVLWCKALLRIAAQGG